jgi:acyl-coenzyme A synthetase/AMP-(fatty) acid ligase
MIKSKGERISAKEVENVICSIEGVSEVAVVGLPDEILGQAIKAYIVPTASARLAREHILKYCAENMESFMVPKYVEFLDELPRTPNGKINKKLLKAEGSPADVVKGGHGVAVSE